MPQLGRDGQLGYSVNVSLERILQQFNLSNPRWAASNARIAIRLEDAIVPHSGEVKFVSSTCPSDDVKCRTQPQKPPLVKGLVLRNAVRVRLTTAVCDAACNAATLSPLPHPGDPLTERPSSEETIPQFGARFLIPVHSGFAQDVALSVALNPDGLITKLQMQSTSALSSNVTTVGGQVSELASGLASPDKATTAANKNLADCLSAQQQVINAGRSPIGTCR